MKIVKVLVLVLTILISTTVSHAQDKPKPLECFFETYKNDAQVSVEIPMFAVKLFVPYIGIDNKVKAIINDVKNAKVYVYNKSNIAKDFEQEVSKTTLQKLLNVKEKGDNIGVYIDQLEDVIKGVFVSVEDKDGNFVVVDLKTDISVEDLQKKIKESDQ